MKLRMGWNKGQSSHSTRDEWVGDAVVGELQCRINKMSLVLGTRALAALELYVSAGAWEANPILKHCGETLHEADASLESRDFVVGI